MTPRIAGDWALPLFTKELTELASKRQTFIVRAAYAAILSSFMLAIWFMMLPRHPGALVELLSIGPMIGNWIYFSQAFCVQWLWPLIVCGTLTVEKERNTLPLLLLTRLTPATIVLEKFFSNMLLATSFLFLSLPLLTLCLSIGGMSSGDMFVLGLVLITRAIELTAIALMCSAYCQTTGSALIATYVVAILTKMLTGCFRSYLLGSSMGITLFGLFFESLQLSLPGSRYSVLAASYINLLEIFQTQIMPSLVIAVASLLGARHFLSSRSFVSTTETSLKSFVDRVGRLAHRLNQNSVTRGAVLIREGRREPDNDPVAWRETTTRALGQPRYLIGNFLTLEMPIIWFLSIVVARTSGYELFHTIGTMQQYLWMGMLMMISTVISGMIIQERRKQTWEILLVTPLTNRDIIQQKMDGIQRMLWILQAPLWTCLIFRAYHEGTVSYVLNEASMLLLYPRIVAWLALTESMKYTNRIYAILGTLLAIVVLITAGALLGGTLAIMTIPMLQASETPWRTLTPVVFPLQASPLTLLICNLMVPNLGQDGTLLLEGFPNAVRISVIPALWNFVLFYGVLRFVKHRCLRRAEKSLRSNPQSSRRSQESVQP